jgi:hypothetical protein
MSENASDTLTISCSEVVVDAHGKPVSLDPANVVWWAIGDHRIAELTQRSDGTATFKALKSGTVNFTCTDTKTGEIGSGMLEVDDSSTEAGAMIIRLYETTGV